MDVMDRLELISTEEYRAQFTPEELTRTRASIDMTEVERTRLEFGGFTLFGGRHHMAMDLPERFVLASITRNREHGWSPRSITPLADGWFRVRSEKLQ